MTAAPRPRLHAVGLTGIGEVGPGDDLAALVVAAAADEGGLRDGDLLAIASKVVSKAAGLVREAAHRDEVVAAESVRVVAARRTPHGLARVVRAAAGPVMAAAGVDASNAGGRLLLLPRDPDAAARGLRARLTRLTGRRLGVVITDTAGRAWRDGQTDFALGAAGVRVTDDLRGTTDPHGQPLEVTVRALADEVAALADLVKGKLDGVPVALVRGLDDLVTDDDGPGARTLLRDDTGDWFRYGHVEAVRAALGLANGAGEPPTVPPGPVEDRWRRAVAAALDSPGPTPGSSRWVVTVDGDRGAVRPGGTSGADPGRALIDLGALLQRLAVTAWSEDLVLDVNLIDVDLTDVRAADGSTPAALLRVRAR